MGMVFKKNKKLPQEGSSCHIFYRPPAGFLNPSGTPEPDFDVAVLHDNRYLTRSAGQLEHLIHSTLIPFDIMILVGHFSPGQVFLRGQSVRSAFFTVYHHLIGHPFPLPCPYYLPIV